jgi:hypothetical protein
VLCKHEVTGSIPVGSTSSLVPPPDSYVGPSGRQAPPAPFAAKPQNPRGDLIGRFIKPMSLPVRSRERDGKILTRRMATSGKLTS